MNKVILALVVMLASSPLFATVSTDSLQAAIDSKKGIERIEARLELAFRARVSNFYVAKKQALTALKELEGLNRNDLKAQAFYYLGASYYYHSISDTALYYFTQAEEIAKKENNNRLLGYIYQLMGSMQNSYFGNQVKATEFYDKSIYHSLLANNHRGLGAVYSELSNMLRNNGSYEKALDYVFRARDSYRKGKYLEGEAWVNYLIGAIYGSTNMYEEAVNYYKEALEIYRELAKEDGIMGGVAICCDQLASVYSNLNLTDIAREYNEEALQLHLQGDSKYGLSTSLKYRADIEYKDANYDTAIAILDSALSIKTDINNVTGFASVYELYGKIYAAKHEYERALENLYIGMNYAVSNNQLRHLADINRHLSDIYRQLGDYEKAYQYKSQQLTIADSIYNASTTRKLLQRESLIEIEKKEKQISQLEHENKLRELSLDREKSIRRYLIGIVVLALIILGMFIYQYFTTRKAHRALLESKKNLEQLNATKDKFFSIIAHDLRGPFNSILGLSELMKKRAGQYSPDDIDKMTGAIYESAKNNYNLLKNLLEWSRSQTGSIPYRPETLSLRETTEDVIAILSQQALEKNIAITFNDIDYHIIADKNMLHTILRNLISNALKYSYSGDTVRIYSEDLGNMIRISVTDSGIGIPENVRKNLFDISESYKIAGTAGEKGTGLGLVICREFVEKHGGSIGVESKQGKGARFWFTMKKA